MEEKIRILIADDHEVVREGIKTLLALKRNMEIVAEARDGVEAVELERLHKPDVILLDLIMPRQDGLAALRAIKRKNPSSRVLVLSTFDDDQKVQSAIHGGAQGYLLKESSSQRLIQAITDVYRGQFPIHPKVAHKLIRQTKQFPDEPSITALTEREIEVLKLVAEGFSNEQIAQLLSITKRTVAKHISNILEKLHVTNRTQAALIALRQGVASLYPT